MVLALAATGIVIVALLGEVMLPRIEQAITHHRARRRRIPQVAEFDADPGRERRAEARARQLLKSCVNDEEWEMYRDLGFIRVWGIEAGRRRSASSAAAADVLDEPEAGSDAAAQARADQAQAQRRDAARQAEWERMEGFEDRPEAEPGADPATASDSGVDADDTATADGATASAGTGRSTGGSSAPGPANRGNRSRRNRLSRRGDVRDEPYAYLVYPHKPILAYVPQTGRLLNEFCVEFPDQTRPYGSARLPDSDDVLAKWMALTGDEQRLIGSANMHLPGRQVDPRHVKRDLWRLRQWERERARAASATTRDSRVPTS
jgi:hypothetical protein